MGIERIKRPVSSPSRGTSKITNSTAASTGIGVDGVLTLRSTSTGGPVVYDLVSLPEVGGQQLVISVQRAGATSVGAGMHVNAAAGSFFGSSSQDMVTMLGQGAGCLLMPVSSTIWAIAGVFGATFSTST